MNQRINSKRAGRVFPALACTALLAIAAISPACKSVVVETIKPAPEPIPGAVGDPCTPSDEKITSAAGFRLSEWVLEDHFAACSSGLCLVNRFQGRVTCPLGQEAPAPCNGPSDPSCGNGSTCVLTENAGPQCDATAFDGGAPQCGSGVCNAGRSTCMCTNDTECPSGSVCDVASQECARYICQKPGGCQSADATDAENAGKSCCAAGTGALVSTAVCGQCEEGSGHTAEEAVYCSCRCGPADGETPDGSDYCACPGGFECSLNFPSVGLGSDSLSGKYCARQGSVSNPTSPIPDPAECGTVRGHFSTYCQGTAAP